MYAFYLLATVIVNVVVISNNDETVPWPNTSLFIFNRVFRLTSLRCSMMHAHMMYYISLLLCKGNQTAFYVIYILIWFEILCRMPHMLRCYGLSFFLFYCSFEDQAKRMKKKILFERRECQRVHVEYSNIVARVEENELRVFFLSAKLNNVLHKKYFIVHCTYIHCRNIRQKYFAVYKHATDLLVVVLNGFLSLPIYVESYHCNGTHPLKISSRNVHFFNEACCIHVCILYIYRESLFDIRNIFRWKWQATNEAGRTIRDIASSNFDSEHWHFYICVLPTQIAEFDDHVLSSGDLKPIKWCDVNEASPSGFEQKWAFQVEVG